MFDLKRFRKENKIKQAELQSLFDCGQSYISALENGTRKVSEEHVEILSSKYGDVSKYIIEENCDTHEKNCSNKIPFYDDVTTIGGYNGVEASTEPVCSPTEWIDTGDWFRNATAAIRHYGESMLEYPQGCILAIKEVYDRDLIVYGRDYLIETSEYRVTKRVQKGADKEHIAAYSTNQEKYADGRLVHEPFDIPINAIIHISLVLGYVVKKNGGTTIYSTSK